MLHFRMKHWLIICGCFFLNSICFSQGTPKPDSCWLQLQKASKANDLGNYDPALRLYDSCLETCKGSMAIIDGNTGKARALNGLQKHNEAIAAAKAALGSAQNKSSAALFERADALFALEQSTAATADYALLDNRSIKSNNPKEKAFIISRLAKLNWRQKKYSQAYQQIAKAISLDPGNASFYLVYGDFYAEEGKQKEAMAKYTNAGDKHADEQVVAKKKAAAYTIAMQMKYKVHDAKELKIKLGISEKQSFCDYWKSLFSTGYSNKQEELYFSLICF